MRDEPLNPTKKACWDKAEEASAAATAVAASIVSGRVQLAGGNAGVLVAGVTASSNGVAGLQDGSTGTGVAPTTAGYRVTCGNGVIAIQAIAVGGADVAAGQETVSYIVKK